MSLNTDIWSTTIPASAPPSRVKVTVDGKDLGTAAEIVVNTQIFGEGSPSVDLKDLDGLADVSFYGHVYRDLRKANQKLELELNATKKAFADSESKLANDKKSSNFWHEQYNDVLELLLKKEKEVDALVQGSNDLVGTINNISTIVDVAADAWNEDSNV